MKRNDFIITPIDGTAVTLRWRHNGRAIQIFKVTSGDVVNHQRWDPELYAERGLTPLERAKFTRDWLSNQYNHPDPCYSNTHYVEMVEYLRHESAPDKW